MQAIGLFTDLHSAGHNVVQLPWFWAYIEQLTYKNLTFDGTLFVIFSINIVFSVISGYKHKSVLFSFEIYGE